MKFLLPALLFFSLPTFGQIISVSEPLNLRDDIAYQIIGQPRNDVLLLRDKNNYFEIQAFNEGLHASWKKDYNMEEYRSRIMEVVPHPDGFYVLYQYKKGGEYFIKQLNFNPAANMIDSLTVKNLGNSFYVPNYDIILSENKNIALFVDFDRYSKFTCFAVELSTMQVLWDKEFELNDFNANRNLNAIISDNRGNMIMILEKENRKSRMEDHHFEVYCVGPNYPELYRVDIPMGTHLSYDVVFDWDNLNQQLIAGGLYIDDNMVKANGYYYLRSDLKSANAVIAFHPFRLEHEAALVGKPDLDETKGVPELTVQEIVLRRDGGMLLFTERVRVYERNAAAVTRSSFDRFARYSVDYYYDDLFVASIHPDGAIHWENVLHKKQYSQDDSAIYSSYFLLKTPTNLRLVFNDEIKNENTISEYILSPMGEAERNSVFSTENQELRIRFRDAIQVAANQFVVPSERRGKLKLVRVTY